MSKHDHLRQGGAFPGGLVNALDDLDARITALEQSNVPKPAPAAEPEPEPGPVLVPDPSAQPEPPAEPEPADPSVQSLESQREPEDGAQGGQS